MRLRDVSKWKSLHNYITDVGIIWYGYPSGRYRVDSVFEATLFEKNDRWMHGTGTWSSGSEIFDFEFSGKLLFLVSIFR